MSTLILPLEASRSLQRAFGPDWNRAAIHALVIEGYRTAKLTAGEVAQILGLETAIAAQAWLKAHGVELNYSLEDLHEDRQSLLRLFPGPAR